MVRSVVVVVGVVEDVGGELVVVVVVVDVSVTFSAVVFSGTVVAETKQEKDAFDWKG